VDYLVVRQNAAAPVEVKSGKRGTLKSLGRYIEEAAPKEAFVASQQNGGAEKGVTWIPLYLASRL
jgi:hypothetical protein